MVGRLHHGSARLLLSVAAATLVGAASVGVAGAGPRTSISTLRGANASLVARSNAAVLDLYSLESRLERARAELVELNAQVAAVERRQAEARARLALATRTLRVSQRLLADRLRVLYEQGEPDPLAILLGASSLDEAVAGIDDLHRAADQSSITIASARRAKVALRTLSRSLAERSARLAALRDEAAATAASLAAAKAERERTIARLRTQQQLNRSQIASLEARAQTIQNRAEVVTARAASPVAAPPIAPPTSGARTLTVSATGYSIHGTTATGAPTGYGIVAVDPNVIPLGSHLSIPGYGDGVAADTGSAVVGATIDLWFPTTAQALAWGRRTVTITIR